MLWISLSLAPSRCEALSVFAFLMLKFCVLAPTDMLKIISVTVTAELLAFVAPAWDKSSGYLFIACRGEERMLTSKFLLHSPLTWDWRWSHSEILPSFPAQWTLVMTGSSTYNTSTNNHSTDCMAESSQAFTKDFQSNVCKSLTEPAFPEIAALLFI